MIAGKVLRKCLYFGQKLPDFGLLKTHMARMWPILTFLGFSGPKKTSTADVLAPFSHLLPKQGRNLKNAISRSKSISTPQILDMLSNEVISTWKHIQKPSTGGSTSLFGHERENPILAIFAHMAQIRGQCQKNFGLKIDFYQ